MSTDLELRIHICPACKSDLAEGTINGRPRLCSTCVQKALSKVLPRRPGDRRTQFYRPLTPTPTWHPNARRSKQIAIAIALAGFLTLVTATIALIRSAIG